MNNTHTAYARIWDLMRQIKGEIPSHYMPALQTAMQTYELTEIPLGMLIHAYDIHPEPLTTKRVQDCVPYYHTRPFQERIDQLVAAGMLTTSDDIHYKLTEDAFHRADNLHKAIYEAIGKIETIPEADLTWLDETLLMLMEDSRAQIDFRPASDMEYKRDRHPDIAPLAKISAAIDVLDNFRCDVHQVAWKTQEISAPAWELFKVFVDGNATTISEAIEFLHNDFPRGYTPEDYQHYAQEVIDLGWLKSEDATFVVTEKGKQIAADVEAKTDELFYAAWHHFNEKDLKRLPSVLSDLDRHL